MDSNPLPLLLLLVSILLLPVNGQQLPSQSLPTLSGYLPITTTTNSSSSSAIYYAYYEAQNPISSLTETPIIIWLQGGPGCSSLIGNFFELGPYRLDPHNPSLQLVSNPGSWNRIFGLLFLDNPIGTGFSIAANQAEIPTDQQTVAKHLYYAITKFMNLDTLFKSRPVYITGESYAGKYVPAIGAYILKRNSMRTDSSRSVNLAGVAIGNGLTDPETQVSTHADNAYFSGFINNKQRAQLEELQTEAIHLVKERKWSEATDARNKVLKMLTNMTGLATLYDFSREVSYETDLVTNFLKSGDIKKLLNANTEIEWEECSDVVESKLHADVMKSVKDKVEYILSKTRVLLYQGHRDLRDGVVSVEAWVKTLNWGQIDKYLAAERIVWRVNGKVAGYVQRWDKLSQVVVLGAGHLVPSDQSLNSQAMIEDWVLQKGMFCCNDSHLTQDGDASCEINPYKPK